MDYQCWIKGEFDRSIGYYGYRRYESDSGYQGEKFLNIGFYGWIVPLLLFQALCFIVPRIHWHYKQEQTIPKSLKKLRK